MFIMNSAPKAPPPSTSTSSLIVGGGPSTPTAAISNSSNTPITTTPNYNSDQTPPQQSSPASTIPLNPSSSSSSPIVSSNQQFFNITTTSSNSTNNIRSPLVQHPCTPTNVNVTSSSSSGFIQSPSSISSNSGIHVSNNINQQNFSPKFINPQNIVSARILSTNSNSAIPTPEPLTSSPLFNSSTSSPSQNIKRNSVVLNSNIPNSTELPQHNISSAATSTSISNKALSSPSSLLLPPSSPLCNNKRPPTPTSSPALTNNVPISPLNNNTNMVVGSPVVSASSPSFSSNNNLKPVNNKNNNSKSNVSPFQEPQQGQSQPTSVPSPQNQPLIGTKRHAHPLSPYNNNFSTYTPSPIDQNTLLKSTGLTTINDTVSMGNIMSPGQQQRQSSLANMSPKHQLPIEAMSPGQRQTPHPFAIMSPNNHQRSQTTVLSPGPHRANTPSNMGLSPRGANMLGNQQQAPSPSQQKCLPPHSSLITQPSQQQQQQMASSNLQHQTNQFNNTASISSPLPHQPSHSINPNCIPVSINSNMVDMVPPSSCLNVRQQRVLPPQTILSRGPGNSMVPSVTVSHHPPHHPMMSQPTASAPPPYHPHLLGPPHPHMMSHHTGAPHMHPHPQQPQQQPPGFQAPPPPPPPPPFFPQMDNTGAPLPLYHLHSKLKKLPEIDRLTFPVNHGNLWGPQTLRHGDQVTEAQFELNQDNLSQIMSRSDLDIIVTSFVQRDIQHRLCHWPDFLELRINGQLLSLDTTVMMPGELKAHVPCCIKKLCRLGSNTIHFSVSKCVCCHQFHAYMVHRPTLQYSVDTVQSKCLSPSSLSKAMILEWYKTIGQQQQQNVPDNMNNTNNMLVLSLICPLSQNRIQIPARTKLCKHLQPFDLLEFLRLQTRWPQYLCPICRVKIIFNLTDHIHNLQVDEWFRGIITRINSTDNPVPGDSSQVPPPLPRRIVIFPDGNWKCAPDPVIPPPESPMTHDNAPNKLLDNTVNATANNQQPTPSVGPTQKPVMNTSVNTTPIKKPHTPSTTNVPVNYNPSPPKKQKMNNAANASIATPPSSIPQVNTTTTNSINNQSESKMCLYRKQQQQKITDAIHHVQQTNASLSAAGELCNKSDKSAPSNSLANPPSKPKHIPSPQQSQTISNNNNNQKLPPNPTQNLIVNNNSSLNKINPTTTQATPSTPSKPPLTHEINPTFQSSQLVTSSAQEIIQNSSAKSQEADTSNNNHDKQAPLPHAAVKSNLNISSNLDTYPITNNNLIVKSEPSVISNSVIFNDKTQLKSAPFDEDNNAPMRSNNTHNNNNSDNNKDQQILKILNGDINNENSNHHSNNNNNNRILTENEIELANSNFHLQRLINFIDDILSEEEEYVLDTQWASFTWPPPDKKLELLHLNEIEKLL